MARKISQVEKIKTVLEKPRIIFKNELDERIEIGSDILRNSISNEDELSKLSLRYHDWDDYNEELLKQAFNTQNNEYWYDYSRLNTMAGMMDYMNGRVDTNSFYYRSKLVKDKVENCIIYLRRLSEKLNLIEESKIVITNFQASMSVDNNKVFYNSGFVVHGHNQERKLEVARFLENDLRKKAIILHEQANRGNTIIEKFEIHSKVDFAVALWTADDTGKANVDSNYKDRARQNVVFETGFFIGKLGRNNVIVLHESGVEIPTDYSGVIFISLSGNWKDDLRKEVDAIYQLE